MAPDAAPVGPPFKDDDGRGGVTVFGRGRICVIWNDRVGCRMLFKRGFDDMSGEGGVVTLGFRETSISALCPVLYTVFDGSGERDE